jgi:threonine synthase
MKPETIATAIRIGSPVNWKRALIAAKSSGGLIETVADEEILQAQKMLASQEGIFVEPASASTIAGARKLAAEGLIDSDEVTVCITTGNGLKDQEAVALSMEQTTKAKPNRESVMAILTQSRTLQGE